MPMARSHFAADLDHHGAGNLHACGSHGQTRIAHILLHSFLLMEDGALHVRTARLQSARRGLFTGMILCQFLQLHMRMYNSKFQGKVSIEVWTMVPAGMLETG